MDKKKYRDVLKQAFLYAKENKSFSKTSIVQNSDNVCVFGLGKYFEDAFIRQDIQRRFKVNYLCDNNPEKLEQLETEKRFENMQYILPAELADVENVVVIIMLGDPRSAISQLSRIIGAERCITYNDLILDDIMEANQEIAYYTEQENNMLKVFDMLDDEKSMEVFVNTICLRIAPHLATVSYEGLCQKPQYFSEDVYELQTDECVVDCGAFVGDTFEEFKKCVENQFEHYYAFELDKENFAKLEANVESASVEKVTCYPYGVWSEDKTISYGKMSSEDSYSIFNQSEVETAKVVSLDNCLKDMKVTLIKMDIEGAEMAALKGAENIICTQKPKMAICVYHRLEDMWNVPLYLKECNENYKICFRHHAEYWVSETVCYAI